MIKIQSFTKDYKIMIFWFYHSCFIIFAEILPQRENDLSTVWYSSWQRDRINVWFFYSQIFISPSSGEHYTFKDLDLFDVLDAHIISSLARENLLKLAEYFDKTLT